MVHICEICRREFNSLRGLNIHLSYCSKNVTTIINYRNSKDNIEFYDTVETNNVVQASNIIEQDEINIEHVNDNPESIKPALKPSLPVFSVVDRIPDKQCYGIGPNEFVTLIDNAYDEIVQWRKNLFKLPSGNAAKEFIAELTKWLEHFNRGTDFEGIALKVFTILPNVIMQKPSKDSKAKDHVKKVEDRLKSWKEGKISELLRESRIIQERLKSNKKPPVKDIAKSFANLMFTGRVNAALKLLSDESENGVHTITDDIRNELLLKHPKPASICEGALLHGPIDNIIQSYFDVIDESMVLKAVSLTKGGSGPSHLDAEQYRHILSSPKYKKEGRNLREQIAKFAQKVATQILDPAILDSYVACHNFFALPKKGFSVLAKKNPR